MSAPAGKIDRRAFCAGLGAGAGTLLLAGCRQDAPARLDASPPTLPLPAAAPPEAMELTTFGEDRAQVVEVRWARAVDAFGKVDATAVGEMLDAALAKLTATSTPYARWGETKRRVGIKVNAISSQAFTHPELAAALARGLVGAGCAPSRVTVWDRDARGLEARGYRLDPTGAQGYRCLGSDSALAPSGTPQSAIVAGAKVYFSPLLLDSDILFTLAALKDHSMAGVSLSLKNNFGMISNAQALHGAIQRGAACEPGISELAARPEIKGRLQLAIIDALVGVCEGGPGPAEPQHVFRYAGLLLSRDPAALDARGLAVIEARRAELGLVPLTQRQPPIPRPPSISPTPPQPASSLADRSN